MYRKSVFIFGLLMMLLLSACQPAAIAQPTALSTQIPIAEAATPATLPPAPTQPAPTTIPCLENFVSQPLAGPNNTDHERKTIYTLSPSEFRSLMGEIGVASFCIPVEAGAPYLQAEWDAAKGTAQAGRMVIVSFDQWREASLVFATYDFVAGTEYDTFASSQDYDAIKNTSQSSFMRIFVSSACFGKCWVYKTHVFPSEKSYLALTLYLEAFEPGQVLDEQVAKFVGGELPVKRQPASQRLDGMAMALRLLPGYIYQS